MPKIADTTPAHALREHARERVGKSNATSIGLRLSAQLLGLGDVGAVGLELVARSAYNPSASVTLWQKMAQATGGGGPAFLSNHPSSPDRIR